MDDFDVISPHGNKRKTFGPLTAYRNVPEIIELFRLIDGDLYDALNNSNTIAIDEWGQLGQDTKTLSMTHVIGNHNEVHVSPGFLPLLDGIVQKRLTVSGKLRMEELLSQNYPMMRSLCATLCIAREQQQKSCQKPIRMQFFKQIRSCGVLRMVSLHSMTNQVQIEETGA